MVGAFIQVNLETNKAHSNPLGYVVQENGCWEWVGAPASRGYGQWGANPTGTRIAHRAMYILHRGPIPGDLPLDHLCRNRACVNPDHLEPVTIKENVLRGEGRSAANARKTSCVRGHLLDGDNLIIHETTGGLVSRRCRLCARERNRAFKRRRRAASRIEEALRIHQASRIPERGAA